MAHSKFVDRNIACIIVTGKIDVIINGEHNKYGLFCCRL